MISDAPNQQGNTASSWLPLDAIGTLKLVPELSEIHRLDGERSATIQGFLSAGWLPSKVFGEFQGEQDQFTSELRDGYSVNVVGDAEIQGDARISWMAYMGVVMTLMLAVEDIGAVQRVVMRDTRHVIATSVTSMAGFVPLMFGARSIWPPVAVGIGFGVAGGTMIVLFFTPAVFQVLMRHSH